MSAAIDPDPRHLFVYGTLLPGLAPAIIAEVVDTLRVIGPATTAGHLYDLGSYPGGKIDPAGTCIIYGQLLEIPAATRVSVLDRLDWYEDFVASDEAGSLFVRRTCLATLSADSSTQRAWVYCYNRDVTHARRIESGRYHAQPA